MNVQLTRLKLAILLRLVVLLLKILLFLSFIGSYCGTSSRNMVRRTNIICTSLHLFVGTHHFIRALLGSSFSHSPDVVILLVFFIRDETTLRRDIIRILNFERRRPAITLAAVQLRAGNAARVPGCDLLLEHRLHLRPATVLLDFPEAEDIELLSRFALEES